MDCTNFFKLGRKISFFVLIIYPQVNFLTQGFGTPLLVLSIVFYLFDFGQGGFIHIHRNIFKYIVLFCAILVMHIFLFLFGQKGYLPYRPLYLYFIVIIVLLYGASILGKSKDGSIWILKSVTICLFVEILITILQFTYITYGFGLAPNDVDSIYAGAITGTYGNPNNVATMITLMIFTLHKNGALSKRSTTSIIIIFLAFFSVFLTMSRTCFILFLLFILLFYFSKSNEERKNYKKRVAQSIIAILPLTIFAWNFNFTDLIDDSIVISRSIDRLLSIDKFNSDNSVEFRVISHTRLLENISNLGIGSFSDLSYHSFFQTYDDWLLKVNPHSFIVEMSFLYGYIGFILASMFILFIAFDVIRSKTPIHLSSFFVISLIYFQMIPSSILGNPLFFLLCVMLASPNLLMTNKLNKSMGHLEGTSKGHLEKPSPPLASDKIPLS